MQYALYEDPAAEEIWDDHAQAEFPLLYSTHEPPKIRSQLHVICALYAHTPGSDKRLVLLDQLEELTLRAAHMLALELLESGWRPGVPAFPEPFKVTV